MSRLDVLMNRRIDREVKQARLLNEVYNRISQSESVRYAIGSMQPIDPDYTRVTFEQGERVKSQLMSQLPVACEYEYQGSVTNDTHIKARSDIDLLVITGEFYYLEPPQAPIALYSGDTIGHLTQVRRSSEDILETSFPRADVDTSGGKSVSIEGGSLQRKVDVVTAAWYNTNDYANTRAKVHRGIKILDQGKGAVNANYPFLNNARIDQKDLRVAGSLRKAARLMKSLKYDSDQVNLTSYDITAIAYAMPDHLLVLGNGQDLIIVERCRIWCHHLLGHPEERDALNVPDGSRRIFTPTTANEIGLAALTRELDTLSRDILMENQRSFSKLEEARIAY
jgi:hypothetical protein